MTLLNRFLTLVDNVKLTSAVSSLLRGYTRASTRHSPSHLTRRTVKARIGSNAPRKLCSSSLKPQPLVSSIITMANDVPKPILNVDQALVATGAQEGEQLSASLKVKGLYQNPWNTWAKPSMMTALKWQLTKETAPLPSKTELDDKLPVWTPDWERIQSPPADEIQVTWMGHASFLVQMDGLNILTDPVWSDRCSPVQFIGPSRYRKPPCRLDELPPIDVVLISHNHYDHLDLHTVRHFRNQVLWVVPDGHRDWFKSESVDRVIEMKWWDHYPVTEKVTISCLPAQHWSKRTAFDDMHALWSGWGVFGSTKKLFFAGDTGYCPGFKEIGDKYGPFDLALIPIGAYEPRWMMRCQHVDPIEAVSIHQDIKSKQSIGMHWGTWVLTDEHILEPPQKLATELAARELDPKSFVALYHGQSFDTASGPAGGRAFGLNDDAEAESSTASSSSPEDTIVEHEKAPRKSKH